MISTILDQIARTFGQTYLVSALAPWVLLWMTHLATCVTLLGFEGSLWWYKQELEPWGMVTISTVVLLFLAVGALVLVSLNGLFKSLLEGDYRLPPFLTIFHAFEAHNQRKAKKLGDTRQQYLEELAVTERFQDLRDHYAAAFDRRNGRPAVADADRDALAKALANWSDPPTRPQLVAAYGAITALFATHNPMGVNDQYYRILAAARRVHRDALDRLATIEAGRYDGLLAADRVRPTRFGNILASVVGYAESRYGLDSIVFWSRLQEVISTSHAARIENARTLMDLMTALTLCAISYGVVWLFAVPLFTSERQWQLIVPLAAFGVAFLFYTAAVEAAASYAELVKAAFDLFRTKLGKAYRLPLPATMSGEFKQWQSLSRFVLYGQPLDVAFSSPTADDEADAPDEDTVHVMD